MPGLTDIPGVEIHGKGTMAFTLPVGYVDPQGKVHDEVLLREMTGEEDDMMGNDDLPIGERVTNVLTCCITKLGDVEDQDIIRRAVADELEQGLPLTEQDRIAAMIFLRRVTLGDIYKFERRCPRCGTMAENRKTDLRELKIGKSDHPDKRRVKVTLPRSGKEAIVKVLTAKGAVAIGRLRPTQKDIKSLAIASRVESIEGERLDDPRLALKRLKELPQGDRIKIRQVYNKMETYVEQEIEVHCRNALCMTQWEFRLDVGQNFFLDLEGKASDEELNWL